MPLPTPTLDYQLDLLWLKIRQEYQKSYPRTSEEIIQDFAADITELEEHYPDFDTAEIESMRQGLENNYREEREEQYHKSQRNLATELFMLTRRVFAKEPPYSLEKVRAKFDDQIGRFPFDKLSAVLHESVFEQARVGHRFTFPDDQPATSTPSVLDDLATWTIPEAADTTKERTVVIEVSTVKATTSPEERLQTPAVEFVAPETEEAPENVDRLTQAVSRTSSESKLDYMRTCNAVWMERLAVLPYSARWLAMVIVYYAGKDPHHVAVLSHQHMERFGLDKNTTRRALKELEDAAVVKVIRNDHSSPRAILSSEAFPPR